MYMYYLFHILTVLLAIVTIGYLAFWIYKQWQGDAKMVLRPCRRDELSEDENSRVAINGTHFPLHVTEFRTTDFALVSSDIKSITMRTYMVLKNIGRQQATVMDCFARSYMPVEYMDGVDVQVRVTDAENPRRDDYWEACLIPPQKHVVVQVDITLKAVQGTMRELAEDFPDMGVDVLYHVFGRSDRYYDKTRIILTGEELRRELILKGAELR